MLPKEPDPHNNESNKMHIEIMYNGFEKIRKTIHSVIVTQTYMLFNTFPVYFL